VTSLAERLARRTLELVDIPSESRGEEAIREHLLSLVPPDLPGVAAGDEAFLFARPRRPHVPLVVLAGHYDTVPAQDNLPGRIADGAVHGLGASDMKGGVAVAIELARDLLDGPPGSYDVALLLFGREELPPEFNPLPALFEASPLLREASLAVLLEPTDGRLQLGSVGNLNARIVFHGVSGHAARPWLADNAIERALAGLAPLAGLERREAIVGGLPFYEVLTITRLNSGIADNVVPDRAIAHVNFRYAPDRQPAEAEAYLRSLVPAGASVELAGNSPAAAPATDSPLVDALRDAGDLELEPKQAWTNVADFAGRGIAAVNFGPGAPRYAHTRDEQVEVATLVRVYEVLRRFLEGPGRVA
jgi:succinyl-diaminopimelate desuccinylase